MQDVISPLTLHQRDFSLQISSEQMPHGEWWASFAVFTNDREGRLVYWMPSLFRAFASGPEARQAAHTAGLEYIEQLKQRV